MPTKNVPPEVYAEINGVPVYHAYNDGEFEKRYNYVFTTDIRERMEYEFDVREVADLVGQTVPTYAQESFDVCVQRVIKKAFAAGLIRVPME